MEAEVNLEWLYDQAMLILQLVRSSILDDVS